MQQPMHAYICGINLRSESFLVVSDLLSHKKGVPGFDRKCLSRKK